MVTYPEAPRRRYGLLVLAAILLVFAGVCLCAGTDSRLIRDLGVIAILASIQPVRLSRGASRTPAGEIQKTPIGTRSGAGRLLWVVSIGLVPMLLASFLLLRIDAANGGHHAWPADVFAGIGILCAGVWGLLVVKVGRS